jgi:thiamine-phosphate pyrophosphorylase
VTGVSRKPGNTAAAGLRLPPLYPIVDVDLCAIRGLDPIAFAAACVRGGARLLQIRQKNVPGTGAFLEIARTIVDAAGTGIRIVINDRADVAAMAGAAGVHVGQQDLPPAEVRAIVGDGAIVGLSTHSEAQIDDAAAGAADYIAVGPIFRTSTKDTGYDPRGLRLIGYAAATGKPVVAIGGITLTNAASVLDAGASSVAIISDLLARENPERRVRDFLERWQR